jgi:acyl-CoA synthetase (NDP forming)
MDLARMVSELKSERDRLDKAISAMEGIERSRSGRTNRSVRRAASNVTSIAGQKPRLSPAARRRISEAQKRRWAERKKAA